MKTLPKGFDETTIMVHQHEWEKDDSTEKKIIDHFVPTSKRGLVLYSDLTEGGRLATILGAYTTEHNNLSYLFS